MATVPQWHSVKVTGAVFARILRLQAEALELNGGGKPTVSEILAEKLGLDRDMGVPSEPPPNVAQSSQRPSRKRRR